MLLQVSSNKFSAQIKSCSQLLKHEIGKLGGTKWNEAIIVHRSIHNQNRKPTGGRRDENDFHDL